MSAKNRTIEALTDFSISDAIQTDAAINRGQLRRPAARRPRPRDRHQLPDPLLRRRQRGGRLRDLGGQRAPVDRADPRRTAKASYAYIGISSQNLYPQLAERLDVPVDDGALIADVVENGPADKAGIKGGGKEIRFQASLVKLGGDVITKVNGRRVTRENDFSEQITRFQPGDTISLELYRGNERRTARVTLGERPDQVPKS